MTNKDTFLQSKVLQKFYNMLPFIPPKPEIGQSLIGKLKDSINMFPVARMKISVTQLVISLVYSR